MGHPEYYGESPFDIRGLGTFRVAVFFAISGFVGLISSLDNDGAPRISRREFISRRALRIVPMMWLAIISYNLLSTFGRGATDWEAVARSMLLWPVGGYRPNVLWTMRHELIFYIIFLLALLRPKKLVPLVAVWSLSTIAYSLFSTTAPEIVRSFDPTVRELCYIFFLEGAANLQFGIGLLAGYLFWIQGRSPPRIPGGFLTVVATMTFGMIVLVIVNKLSNDGTCSILLQALLSTIVLAVAIAVTKSSGVLARVGETLGQASYSIFLFHSAVILCFVELDKRLGFGLPLLVTWAIITGVSVLAGITIHHLIERPLSSYLVSFREKGPSHLELK
jgi:peptidoglycan/LPS O-acetylase OafA/YrhL